MKKTKWFIMALTIVASVTAAFTTKPKFGQCDQMAQYYYNGSVYVQAGESGVDYVCATSGSVCTYVTTDQIHYTACITGETITLLDANGSGKKENKKPEVTK